ncbi:unnamed protein product [Cylicocyclus nassatus]|uniref:Protein KRI1 homolog n=1 Tax=Cylicocyclus nassatus TaxID=53992 RepID=A0AA36MD58_CYLNA|nr:unnamed protein product [Cylicocyclus nassatus]
MKLLDSDDEDEAGPSLEINKNYAERYDNWRRLEEMQKIKDKYGDDMEDTSSSEEEPEWSAADEMHFLRTLSALKGNEASIYDEKSNFWDENEEKAARSTKKKKKLEKEKEKPMYLKDYERKLVLEKGGQIDESDEEDERKHSNYFDQQEQIRNALRKEVEKHDNDEDDDDDLLLPKNKTNEEKAKEDEDFYSWLKERENGEIGEGDDLKGLKEAWRDPNIDENEKFLRDYLANKDFIPEIEEHGVTLDDLREVEEDEKDLDRQRDFEQKYNFRFEDPDQEFIKQYPRTVGESIRKTNSKRKEKREEYKERKEREKQERRQEIKELKKMKRAEIEKKLEKLKKMAGDDIPISIDDIEGDFDPKEYDRRMQQLFNDEYYGKSEDIDEVEQDKPVFSDMDDSEDESSSSDYDNFPISTVSDSKSNGVEQNATSRKENGENTQNGAEQTLRTKEDSRRKKKRNSKFREAVQRKKPLFDPKEKTFEEYFNEYYALDYEDIIGDKLTRFKYRQVVPNDFGLSVGEILSADDRQLNAWASLKKATGYRSEHEEMVEKKRYERKAADLRKKEKIFSTDFGGKRSKKHKEEEAAKESKEAASIIEEEQKKQKKKKKKKAKEAVEGESEEVILSQPLPNSASGAAEIGVVSVSGNEQSQKKKKKRNRKRKAESAVQPGDIMNGEEEQERSRPKKKRKHLEPGKEELKIDDSRLRAYGLQITVTHKVSSGLRYGRRSQLFSQLQVGEVVTTIPTIGFNVEQVEYKNLKFQVWDLGGQTSIRPYWRCYYANTDAIIYVVDSADKDRVGISRQELVAMLQEEELQGAILAVLANKQDIPGCLTPAEVHKALGLEALRNRTFQIFKTSAAKGEGLDEAMEWLANNLQQKK